MKLIASILAVGLLTAFLADVQQNLRLRELEARVAELESSQIHVRVLGESSTSPGVQVLEIYVAEEEHDGPTI